MNRREGTDKNGAHENVASSAPIGVFDSGIGGLTVVAALRRILPSEQIFYIGDTARVPYGGKSKETIERYSMEIAEALIRKGAKMIVVACNTASALALESLKRNLSIPVQGVILPGAAAAVKATKNKRIGIVGTRATIASGAYEKAIRQMHPLVEVGAVACPLLVPLIEEGLFEDSVTEEILRRYIDPLLRTGVDTMVLGCTHYPLLRTLFAKVAGEGVVLVDSAENCALSVKALLESQRLAASLDQEGGLEVVFTDPLGAFLELAATALGLEIGKVGVRSMSNLVSA